ncbi:decaprenyl-phosphate phosphoribosyltransferase [Thermomicrobium sp. 4228-Ro]|uniref:decaprenyl-phosphate phosphoribosyltransferase n=1 Tax=Thermomicrobium sp. 4228-Ro TaxID=2993937 RepID=UPI002248F0FF|nr:decaprenyl-phosphate phosphoribosyltransferase [Thermomicrobium sp. 4228-Ro]MCX2727701.1 decaprenyl-phosphate phosphoribosyltransferase [Thermomicrobium sp. 4228-Ro]
MQREWSSTLTTLSLLGRDLLVTARPRQWLKNTVVLAPLVFGRQLLNISSVIDAAFATLSFCLAGSAIYFFNDWCDAAADREHPLKCLRPIAAGRLGRRHVWSAIVLLLFGAIVFAWAAGGATPYVVSAYVGLMIGYTVRFKHVALLDIFVIATGFVLRVWAGATAVGVPLSPWLYICTVLLALFLAVAKRRHEVLLLEGVAANHRPALDEYSVPLLDALLHITATATIMTYSLYTFFAPSLPDDHSMMVTIPFVLYGIFRYLYLVYRRDLGGVPEQVLLDDRPLLLTIVVWGLLVLVLLYR